MTQIIMNFRERYTPLKVHTSVIKMRQLLIIYRKEEPLRHHLKAAIFLGHRHKIEEEKPKQIGFVKILKKKYQ